MDLASFILNLELIAKAMFILLMIVLMLVFGIVLVAGTIKVIFEEMFPNK